MLNNELISIFAGSNCDVVNRRFLTTWLFCLLSAFMFGQTVDNHLSELFYAQFGDDENQNLTGEHRSFLSGVDTTDEFTFYFRSNQFTIDETYLWNPSETALLRNILKRDIARIDTLTIYAYSSPEGSAQHNAWLSRKRAEATLEYILAHSHQAPGKVNIIEKQENWPGLRQAVRTYYSRNNRDSVLAILGGQMSDEARKEALKNMDEGTTYRYLIDTLMRPLRNSTFVIRWSNAYKDMCEAIEPVTSAIPSGLPLITDIRPGILLPSFTAKDADWAKRTIFALKTNALYDAVTALNYSIEVPIGDRFSIAWQHYFPWWHTQKELKYCLQYLTLGGEFRWWMAPRSLPESVNRMLRDALTGHFVGVYGFWGKTDIQVLRDLGMYQCANVLSAGLTYGYSFPVSHHWNMELSISAGYARIPYQHYIPSDDWQHLWRDPENTGVMHYFGPTNVAVSLVRPIVIKYKK